MIGLKQVFPEISQEQWEDRLKKDLKATDLSALHFVDEVENISFNAHNYIEKITKQNEFARGFSRPNNDWKNGCTIDVTDASTANKKALQVLMQGADALLFHLHTSVDLSVLLEKIEVQYIHVAFITNNVNQAEELIAQLEYDYSNCAVALDLIGEQHEQSTASLFSKLKAKQLRSFLSDGYSLQQCGANAIQEIAFMLGAGNEYLQQLIESGLSIDEASACVHFRTGLGSNYFQQIAKIRAFRALWSTLVDAYQPQHRCSLNTHLWAQTGALNKSAKDPYTNLLRQTTEAMAALNAGVELICVEPFDKGTQKGTSPLAERMALNIPLILKEESYLDKVIDPLGGSSAIEKMTLELMEKSWRLFQEIEASGGIQSPQAKELIQQEVRKTAAMRLQQFKTKEKTLIGINKFPNPEVNDNEFTSTATYFGLPFIHIENELNK